jgi:hypothetical protein
LAAVINRLRRMRVKHLCKWNRFRRKEAALAGDWTSIHVTDLPGAWRSSFYVGR